MQSLNQRVAARNYLSNLNSTETAEYILEHLHRVGRDSNHLFDTSGLHCIHELTEGCPRLINQLCDHALILGMTQGEAVISSDLLREAWADLQCFPEAYCQHQKRQSSKSSPSSTSESQWPVIEFGSLDEEGDASFNQAMPCGGDAGAADHLNFSDGANSAASNLALGQDSFGQVDHCEPESWWQPGSMSTFDNAYESQTDWVTTGTDRPQVEISGPGTDPFELSDQLYQQPRDVTWNDPAELEPMRTIAANPFDERFENVEVIQQRFAPMIAQCNRASQDLTNQDLEVLNQWQSNALAAESTHTAFSHENQPSDSQQKDFNFSQPTESHQQVQPGWADLEATEDFNSNNGDPILEPTSTTCEVTSTDVAREADLLIQKLCQSLGETTEPSIPAAASVSHDTGTWVPGSRRSPSAPFTIRASEPPAQQQPIAFVAKSEMGFDQAEFQQMETLKQVIEEQNRFSARAFGGLLIQPSIDSPNVGWKVTPASATAKPQSPEMATDPLSPARRDDRDMIVCQSSEPQYPDAATHQIAERVPFPPTPVSTGRAERMDYHKLFDQLRKLPNT
jgi:hypothetical protein